jgi:hypothetical protein
MKNIFFLVSILIFSGHVQSQTVKEKLNDFFFDLTFHADINVIRLELKNDPDFKFYRDPNRDTTKTIIGKVKSNKNLNPICSDNQVIIQYSSGQPKKTKKISLKWSMNYRLEDLASARFDFDKLTAQFKPLFKDFSEEKKTGVQRDVTNSVTFRKDGMVVIIKLIEYINYTHAISLEYRDTWKIEAINILKVKN